jgi:hypothetical protein
MARESVSDRWGNEIYLTDERWDHIVETHDEMMDYRSHVLMTVRTGQRDQDPEQFYPYGLPGITEIEGERNGIPAFGLR